MSLPLWAPARSVALLSLVLGACGGSKVEGQCSEDTPCDDFATCVDGECVRNLCSVNADCGMEAYCAGDGRCTGGCQSGDDCYPGDTCNLGDNRCVAGGCRSTTLDCGFNEFCDPAVGDCYDAGGTYCEPCTNDNECGGDGDLCLNLGGGYGRFCGAECASESDCPGGYTCIPISDEFGQVFTYQCITYCWLFIDDEGERRRSAADAGLGHPVDLQADPVGFGECAVGGLR